MKSSKNLSLIILILLPFVYLAYLWNQLPESVPLHWDINGTADRFGAKARLIFIPAMLPLFTYLSFLIAPKLDPKKQLDKMGGKLINLRFIMTLFMSVLALFILNTIQRESNLNPNYMLALIGLLVSISGNFFKTIRANYFIGIRTPWTLENETVWKKTHKMAGNIWFVGGLIMILSCLLLSKDMGKIIFYIVTFIIVVIPIVYSYFSFQNVKQLS